MEEKKVRERNPEYLFKSTTPHLIRIRHSPIGRKEQRQELRYPWERRWHEEEIMYAGFSVQEKRKSGRRYCIRE
jgi:hypothetical protein